MPIFSRNKSVVTSCLAVLVASELAGFAPAASARVSPALPGLLGDLALAFSSATSPRTISERTTESELTPRIFDTSERVTGCL